MYASAVVAVSRLGSTTEGLLTFARSGWVVLAGGVVVVSAAWVYVDAHSIGARRGLRSGFTDLGPLGWACCTLLLWVVTLPMYLAARPRIRAEVRERERPVRTTGASQPTDQPGWQQLRAFGGPGAGLIDLTDRGGGVRAARQPSTPGAGGAGTAPPPGWYLDPEGSGLHRWWDGRRWTEHRVGSTSS